VISRALDVNRFESWRAYVTVTPDYVFRVGDSLGMAINGARLHLNKSKTLGLESKCVGYSDRTIYFGVNLEW